MIREIGVFGTNENVLKVLVCITAQSNSKRLIDMAASKADELNAELHILNVQKGTSIFNDKDMPARIQELFSYGTEKGGMIHAYCDEDIPGIIGSFIEREKITHIILGSPPNNLNNHKKEENQFNNIVSKIPKNVKVIIFERNGEI
ncbi:hypothetical protein SDC9_193633 [bioreactor metagenome]|uniref:UspA domain-containing protein n=1 Tax=bioreactor metagenome TaxID=1076179 RepID=A0A645IFA4_9ZZZZ|nr:hypothetical protein [Lachnospiraceae bacterium]